jgi:hypothetical protein
MEPQGLLTCHVISTEIQRAKVGFDKVRSGWQVCPQTDVSAVKMLRSARMAAMTGCTAAS